MQLGKVKRSFWNLDGSVQQSEAGGRQSGILTASRLVC